jgi:SagB-type dehydrogenase family enzyme
VRKIKRKPGGSLGVRGVRKPRRQVAYRRASSLVFYWQKSQLVFENFALRTRISAEPVVCLILDHGENWRTLDDFVALLRTYTPKSILKILETLCRHGVLERSDRTQDSRETAMKVWADWNPAAGFFHFSTKDVEFAADTGAVFRELKKQARRKPMPLPVKRYPSAPRVELNRTEFESEFPAILRRRRTWRRFARQAVPLEALATLLELTFGIQGWARVPGLGTAAMKTSPSAGCLHPIEAYLVARDVKGLRAGIYHYDATGNALEWLRPVPGKKAIQASLGHQSWFAAAPFLVLMTAVFRRTRWKYDFARVYRGILIEAGHLCQTFCLTATWLGLGPFTTMALSDTKWEQWLGIDGVSESVLYAAGAGMPADARKRDAHLGRFQRAQVNGSLSRLEPQGPERPPGQLKSLALAYANRGAGIFPVDV